MKHAWWYPLFAADPQLAGALAAPPPDDGPDRDPDPEPDPDDDPPTGGG